MVGASTGVVRWLLRLEGLCVLAAALYFFWQQGSADQGPGWWIFALLFLAPDLSLLGYLFGPRLGALAYNAAHTYVGAAVCFAAGIAFQVPAMVSAATIWCAHIGFDRALGYGLKYTTGFGATHLGRIGRGSGSGAAASEV